MPELKCAHKLIEICAPVIHHRQDPVLPGVRALLGGLKGFMHGLHYPWWHPPVLRIAFGIACQADMQRCVDVELQKGCGVCTHEDRDVPLCYRRQFEAVARDTHRQTRALRSGKVLTGFIG
jgi:hypothetical protein